MKIFIVFFIIFFIPLGLLKAQPGMQDVIYLKNGSILKGTITEHIIGSQVKIMISGGTVFSFQYNEIEKMVKEEITVDYVDKKSLPEKPVPRTTNPKKNGISGSFANGLNLGENSRSISPLDNNNISMMIALSYIIKYHYSVGVGLGVENFNGVYLPTYLVLQYRPLKNPAGPFLYGIGGYSSPGIDNRNNYGGGGNSYSGGALVEGGMGIQGYVSSNIKFHFTIGYRYQESSFTSSNYNWQFPQTISGKDFFRRIALRMGMTIE